MQQSGLNHDSQVKWSVMNFIPITWKQCFLRYVKHKYEHDPENPRLQFGSFFPTNLKVIPKLILNEVQESRVGAWRWHVTVGGDSHREILIFCHRHRHRHRRRKKYSPSPSPPGKKISPSPSPSPPNKKIFTVIVTAGRYFFHRNRHRHRQIYFLPSRLQWEILYRIYQPKHHTLSQRSQYRVY